MTGAFPVSYCLHPEPTETTYVAIVRKELGRDERKRKERKYDDSEGDYAGPNEILSCFLR